MSTHYTLLETNGFIIEALEHSSVVNLSMWEQHGNDRTHEVRDLTVSELTGLALELLKVASYVGGDLSGAQREYLSGRPDADYYRTIIRELKV